MGSNAPSSRPLIFLGAGEHAGVLLDLVRALGCTVRGVCDARFAATGVTNWRNLPVLGDDRLLESVARDAVYVVNALGVLPGKRHRHAVSDKIRALGFETPPLIHPTAYVASDVSLAPGTQIMAGVVISTGSTIGDGSIVNTKSSIDHDCSIAADVHVAPGCTICGGVTIGRGAFVGAGVTIINGLHIGDRALVGAGTTVTTNLDDDATCVLRAEANITRSTS